MDFARYVQEWISSVAYRGQVEHIQTIPERKASFADPDIPLPPVLNASLHRQGIHQLYTHQAAALDAIRRGEHVLTVTSTASGKTLCYNLPVLETALSDPAARALYLYPTKALAQDQMGKLNNFGLFPQVRFATYDGDTPQTDRRYIRKGAHLVLTNPDMLHTGILPHHTRWSAFFAFLRYIVLDEVHTYRGVFGAHVAQTLRRLRRICAYYGANPQFIGTSATIANPSELFLALTGHSPTVIEEDGSPSSARTFVFWNPPLIGENGERRSAHVEATALFTDLVANRVRNITFAKARKSAELILKYAREVFAERNSALGEKVMCYRAGYSTEERRAIERGLFEGDLIGVISTNALELGVDVGGLDATILTGYPGTISSAWQQAGRSGRTGEEALTVMIAMDNPLDQYLMRHPEYFFGRRYEQAIVNPNNRRILKAHLACAAFELPLSGEELALFGEHAGDALEQLMEEGLIVLRGSRFYYRTGDDYPAAQVNIRSASSETFEIRDISRDGLPFGSIEGERVYSAAHPGAIYLHQGETYLVERLDEQSRLIDVRPVEVNYYTEPRELVFLTVLSEQRREPLGNTVACFGEVVVTSQVMGYRQKQLYSDKVLAMVDLDLPERAFETEGFWLTVPQELALELGRQGYDLNGSIHAVEHAAISLMPLLAMCDRWDIGGVSAPNHPDTGMATIFIYDAYPGGIGIAETTYHRLHELLLATREMIERCPCTEGCPSCIQSPKCGNNNEPLDKQGAAYLLMKILAGEAQGKQPLGDEKEADIQKAIR
jgi:DEAD/DEAH box helicase domain-containing protein